MKEEWRGISPPQVGPGSTGPVPYNVLYTPSLAEQISSMANASCICLVTSFTPFIRVASSRQTGSPDPTALTTCAFARPLAHMLHSSFIGLS